MREQDRRVRIDSGIEKKLRGVIVKELEEIKKNYGDERRTDHRGRSRRNQAGRPDCRRAGCGHGQPRRLHEAHAHFHLSPAAPRRHRAHRHEDARRGFRRAPVHRLDPRLHPGLHQHRTRVLAEGVRDSRRGRRRQGQAHRQPGVAAARARTSAPCCRCATWKKKDKYIFFATRKGTVKKTPLKDF